MHDIYKIMWEKWHDPFGQDLDQIKETDYDNEIDDLPQKYIKDPDTDQIFESEPVKKKSVKVIASPMGLIPYNEHTACGKIFNFWIGHCNFDITNDLTKIIETTDGVEILDIFTRYRFRIGIGKCFGDGDTMTRIQNNIYGYLDEQNKQSDTE